MCEIVTIDSDFNFKFCSIVMIDALTSRFDSVLVFCFNKLWRHTSATKLFQSLQRQHDDIKWCERRDIGDVTYTYTNQKEHLIHWWNEYRKWLQNGVDVSGFFRCVFFFLFFIWQKISRLLLLCTVYGRAAGSIRK